MNVGRGRAALVLVGVGVALGAGPWRPADALPRVGDPVVSLHVVDQSFAVSVDDPFDATLALAGPADELAAVTQAAHGQATTSEGGPAEVRVRALPAIPSSEALLAFDESVSDADSIDAVTVPADEVFTDADSSGGNLTVPVGIDDVERFALPGPGIYPVTIDVVVAGAVVASTTTFVELFDTESVGIGAPLAVSILAGIADPGPWPSPMELSSASIEAAKLIDLAEAVDGPLSISLPPSLVAALSSGLEEPAETSDIATPSTPDTTVAAEVSTQDVTGSTQLVGAPGDTEPAFSGLDSPAAFADAFRADELFAVPAIALDPSSLVAIDQSPLFTEQLRAGEDILSTASPRAVVSRAVWLSPGPVSGEAMVMLRNLGIRMLVVTGSAASELGVPSTPGDSGLFSVDLVADGSLPALILGGLGAQLATPVHDDPSATANERAVRLLVELQLHRAATGTPAVVLATPRVTVPDPAITAQFVDLASGTPSVAVVPVSRLPGTVDGAVSAAAAPPVHLPSTAGPDLSARLARVAATRIDASHATRMLVDPARGEAWADDLTRVMSTAIDDATASQVLDATGAQVDAVLDAIVPPDAETLRLTGTSSTLRLRVENTYDQPLNVLIHVRSPKLTFPNPDPLETVAAGESRLIEIPVEARSNGTFTIEVDVLSPDRAPLSDPIILKARVTRLTGLSQVVTGAAGLVLASWWYSHIRRSRRRRVLAAQATADAADAMITLSPDAAATMAPLATAPGRHGGPPAPDTTQADPGRDAGPAPRSAPRTESGPDSDPG